MPANLTWFSFSKLNFSAVLEQREPGPPMNSWPKCCLRDFSSAFLPWMWVWDSVSDHDPLLELGPEDCSNHVWMTLLRIILWFPSCSTYPSDRGYAANHWSPVGMHRSFSSCFSKVSSCTPSYNNLNLFRLNEKKMHANTRTSRGSRTSRSWERRGAPDGRSIMNVSTAMQTLHHQALFREPEHMTPWSYDRSKFKTLLFLLFAMKYDTQNHCQSYLTPHYPPQQKHMPWNSFLNDWKLI